MMYLYLQVRSVVEFDLACVELKTPVQRTAVVDLMFVPCRVVRTNAGPFKPGGPRVNCTFDGGTLSGPCPARNGALSRDLGLLCKVLNLDSMFLCRARCSEMDKWCNLRAACRHRFSAFWLRSKCSICSYQLNI